MFTCDSDEAVGVGGHDVIPGSTGGVLGIGVHSQRPDAAPGRHDIAAPDPDRQVLRDGVQDEAYLLLCWLRCHCDLAAAICRPQ